MYPLLCSAAAVAVVLLVQSASVAMILAFCQFKQWEAVVDCALMEAVSSRAASVLGTLVSSSRPTFRL
uniref:Putative secreted peptide n=1 Tax=Anopheles braziliensis TaxID=58242 RepID=A0A2M3ZRA5_9DIPT